MIKAEAVLENKINPQYWYHMDTEKKGKSKPKLMIDELLFYDYLKNKGYRWLNTPGTSLGRPLVCVVDNVVTEIDIDSATSAVFYEVADLPKTMRDKAALDLSLSSKIRGGIMKKPLLNKLSELATPFQRDTADASFFFFANTVVKVTAAEIVAVPYKDMSQPIWASQIKQHNIEILNPSVAEDRIERFGFCNFIANTCTNPNDDTLDEKRLAALKTCIGYLSHNYNDYGYQKVVVFSDASLDPIANGGTGKSLICGAVGQLRKVTIVNGKDFNNDNRFALQDLCRDTHVVCFDDVKRKFKFEVLNNYITSSYGYEKKNKDRYLFPPTHSPKTSITTNFTIRDASGETTKRRMYSMELYNYYNSEFTPMMEFKETFFKWETAVEWNTFYNYMFLCSQLYFKNKARMLPYISTTLLRRNLIHDVGEGFTAYADEVCKDYSESRKLFQLSDLLADYMTEVPSTIAKTLSTQWIHRNLQRYCEMSGYKLRASHTKIHSDTAKQGRRTIGLYDIEYVGLEASAVEDVGSCDGEDEPF
jgi:hypothetical protein